MNYQDIAALITIRQFSYNVLDNPSIKLNRDQLRALGGKLSQLDNMIVSSILSMDTSDKKPEEIPQIAPPPAPPTDVASSSSPTPLAPIGKPVAVEVPVSTEVIAPVVPVEQKMIPVQRVPAVRRSRD